jgi:hypothetical protein
LRRDLRVSANRLRRKGEQPGSGLNRSEDCGGGVATILWIIAALCVIGGIVTLIRGAVLYDIVLIIVGLLIGPGGASIFC